MKLIPQLPPGGKVLVHAGAGGVGSFAVQFAKVKPRGGKTIKCGASCIDFTKNLPR